MSTALTIHDATEAAWAKLGEVQRMFSGGPARKTPPAAREAYDLAFAARGVRPGQRVPAHPRVKVARSADLKAECEAIAQRLESYADGKRKLGTWVALEFALDYSHIQSQRLQARIEALEELLGRASAKAPQQKTLKINFIKDITDETVKPVIAKIEAAHDRDVRLTIASQGGHVDAAERLAAAIIKHGRVDTHSVVHASSAALLVFAAGRRRSSLKGCNFLIHAPTIDGEQAITPEQQKILDKCAINMARFLGKRTRKPAATFLRMMTDEGRVLDAGEASMLNLINTLVTRPHQPRKAA